ncbi:hypothetical protein PHISP_07902 [Aspergillus sp. HF37]|nr:hypothetical protein PHISP_07902 [Aspergillus sp. HF37]
MIVPKPPMKLEGHCSVIHNNTLYVFSPNGFASIPLQRNGTWSDLKPGESVSGAACVSAGVNGHNKEEALYVVGGTGSSKDYTGLQRYSFQSEQWETVSPKDSQVEVTSNRTGHGAVYLKSSSSILMYGGSQGGGTTPSSETFAIDTASPYTVSAYSTTNAAPAVSPILLPWNGDKAALVGATTDQKVHIFHHVHPPADPWSKPITSLTHELPGNVQCALLSRPDGSKVLETFDMSVTPSNVTSIALLGPQGKPVKPSKVVGGTGPKRSTKDGAFGGYPAYEDQFAPMKTWKDYSLAQGDNNLVAISGGSGIESLAIFNQTSNSWVNATKLFYGDESRQQILGPTSTSSSTPTSSPSGSSAPVSDSDSTDVGTIIGATLGGVVGFAIILMIILLFLRRVKKKRAAQAGNGSDDNRLSFRDQGEEPLARSAYPMAKSPVPFANSSVDSLAIVSGNVGDEKSPRHLGSSGQVTPANDKAFEAQEMGAGGQAGDRTTDEGWSKYFVDNNSATDLARQSDRSLSGSDFGNPEPKENAWPMKSLTPLNFGFLDEPRPLGQVITGSPTTGHSPIDQDGRGLVIPEGQSAQISSADSISVNSEENDRRRETSWPNFAGSIGEEDEVPQAAQRSWLGRPPSSTYSSVYYGEGRETMASTGRQSSVVIPENAGERTGRSNVNTDMSWLNLNAER